MAQVYKIDNKRYEFVEIDSSVNTSYILTEADHNKWIKIDTDANSVNLQLPLQISEGFKCVVENIGQFTINYVNAGGTSIATQQDTFTEDKFRTVEIVRNGTEWRVQGFVGRNDVSSLYDVNVTAQGPLSDGQVLAYDGQTGNWRADDRLVYIPRSPEVADFVLQESDHAKIIPVNTNAAPVDVAINLGLPSGFYCKIVNIGTGNLTITSAPSLDIATTSINQKYGYVDLFHQGFETWTGLIGRGGIEGGEPYFLANSGGSTPTATGINSVAIGPSTLTTINATSGVALGNAASVDAANAVQIGDGNNDTANTLAFRDKVIANDLGLVAHVRNGPPSIFAYPPNVGQLYIDATTDFFYWADGSNWHSVEPGGQEFFSFNRTSTGSPGNDFQSQPIDVWPSFTERGLLVGSENTLISGNESVLIGNRNEVRGIRSVAIGYDNTVTGPFVVGMGSLGSDSCVAIGDSCYIGDTVADAVAIGHDAQITLGDGAIQLGTGTYNGLPERLSYIDEVIATKAGIKVALTTGAPTITNTVTEGAQQGLMKFDPVTNTLYIYNGSAWVSTVLT